MNHQLVLRVRDALAASNARLVLAESCTAGNVAGALAVVPGISAWLCGSFVVYRNESKAQWLGIGRQLLDDPDIGPVSAQVTRLLCEAALKATPEADIAAAVTGHIGPGCPANMDGQVFFCLTKRTGGQPCQASTRLSAAAPRMNATFSAARHDWPRQPLGSSSRSGLPAEGLYLSFSSHGTAAMSGTTHKSPSNSENDSALGFSKENFIALRTT